MSQLDQLENEANAQRALFAHTVDSVLTRFSEAKSELSPAHQGERWLKLLEQSARDNPVQAASAAVLLAYPLWRLVRALPLPVTMAGGALFLSSKVRVSTTQAGQLLAESGALARDAAGRLLTAGAQARDVAVEKLETLAERAADAASTSTEAIQEATRSAATAAKTAVQRATESATIATSGAVQAMRLAEEPVQNAEVSMKAADSPRGASIHVIDSGAAALSAVAKNPLLIAGLGLISGGIIAAILPHTAVDSRLLGSAARAIRGGARQALESSREAAADTVSNLTDRAALEAEKRGLDADSITNTLDAVTAELSGVAASQHSPKPADWEEIDD